MPRTVCKKTKNRYSGRFDWAVSAPGRRWPLCPTRTCSTTTLSRTATSMRGSKASSPRRMRSSSTQTGLTRKWSRYVSTFCACAPYSCAPGCCALCALLVPHGRRVMVDGLLCCTLQRFPMSARAGNKACVVFFSSPRRLWVDSPLRLCVDLSRLRAIDGVQLPRYGL